MNNKRFGKLKQFQRRRNAARRLYAERNREKVLGPSVRAFVRYMALLQLRQANRLDSVKRLFKKGRVTRTRRKELKLSDRRRLAHYRRLVASGFFARYERIAQGLPEHGLHSLADVKRLLDYHRVPTYSIIDWGFGGFEIRVPDEFVENVNEDAQRLRLVGCPVDVKPLEIQGERATFVVVDEFVSPAGEEPPYVEVKHDGTLPAEPPAGFIEAVTPNRYSKWDV